MVEMITVDSHACTGYKVVQKSESVYLHNKM